MTAIVVGLQVAGIPYFYARSIGSLNLGRLTSEQVRIFKELGLTPEFYAAYTVDLPVGTVVVFRDRHRDLLAKIRGSDGAVRRVHARGVRWRSAHQ